MTAEAEAGLAALAARLGHDFADIRLLETALTHGSAAGSPAASYQRLEFLGDRVLALVITEMLLSAYPKAMEGELAQRLTALIRNETCADVAVALDMGPAIRLGQGEALSGGRRKAAILGDVCEAVIGALYVDGGLDVARRFIAAEWGPRMLGPATRIRDAKTTLQEWAQSEGGPPPQYRIVERSGPDHAPRFVVEVALSGGDARTRGEGGTRREAEQAAATAMLNDRGVWKAAAADDASEAAQ